MSWRGAGHGRDEREHFPETEDEIGEDPARYLDTPTPRYALARIRGIDKIDVCQAWLRVEHELERGPRESVVECLEARLAYLQEHGERVDDVEPKELNLGPWPPDTGTRTPGLAPLQPHRSNIASPDGGEREDE